MPEGPEIRREALALADALVGVPVARVDYRVPGLAAKARRLRGARVTRVTSRGKAVLIDWDAGLTHFSHNQLYGAWRVLDAGDLQALLDARAPSVRVVIATARHAAVLLSSTVVELLEPAALAVHPYLANLGPDVLDASTTVNGVVARLRAPRFARRSLAALLLDQSFLAGLGNYLRSEILHVARLRHTRRADALPAATLATLARATLVLPRQSLATGGITNDRRLARSLRARGEPFERYRFRVYAREGRPCHACGTRIRRVDVAGRGVYFCPRCQPA
jgi:endonuclease-8